MKERMVNKGKKIVEDTMSSNELKKQQKREKWVKK